VARFSLRLNQVNTLGAGFREFGELIAAPPGRDW